MESKFYKVKKNKIVSISGPACRSGGHFDDCFQSSLSLNMAEARIVELVDSISDESSIFWSVFFLNSCWLYVFLRGS